MAVAYVDRASILQTRLNSSTSSPRCPQPELEERAIVALEQAVNFGPMNPHTTLHWVTCGQAITRSQQPNNPSANS